MVVAAIGGGLVLFTVRTVRKVEAALPPAGRFVDVPGAQLTLVDGGHMLPITAPDRTAQFIREAAARALT